MTSLFAFTPYVVVVIVVAVLAAIAWRIDDWGRDWTTNRAELRADSPDPQLRPVRVAESPPVAADRLTAGLAGRPAWSTVDRSQAGATVRLQLTHRTSVFRFVDDVDVTIEPAGEGSLIAAASRSRIGKGDLGQNPRNLRELVSIVRSELSPRATEVTR